MVMVMVTEQDHILLLNLKSMVRSWFSHGNGARFIASDFKEMRIKSGCPSV
jgi:hypothetical protein